MKATNRHFISVRRLINQRILTLIYLLQCTIAHALEKTKYPDSDIYWKSFEEKYHFSCQFTADLIAMNHADFIITSTYQEIAGRCKFILSPFNITVFPHDGIPQQSWVILK